MEDMVVELTDLSSELAILEGGPPTIPAASRVQQVRPQDDKVKLPHYGGYEHFERTGSLVEDASCRHVIYRWCMRTKIAE
jgi:hypothetical protein